MPFDASKPILLFATDNTGMSVTLYDCPPFDGTYSNPDDAEDGPVREEEVVLPQPVDETAHYRDIIFNFFRRIKQNREQRAAVTRGSTLFVTQFDPTVLITEFTTHSHIFVVPMEHKVYQIHGCSGDYLNVKGSFEVIYSIKPCYLFENNGDNAGDYYIVKADLKLTHNSYAYWNTIASSHRSFTYDNNSFTFNIPAPNRQPFGILALANNHNKVVSNIKIYNQDNVADKDTLCLSRGYLKGQEAKCALPEGTYIVDYDLKNGDDNTIDSRWRIKNIIITNGGTEEASTAYISTDSAIERNSK